MTDSSYRAGIIGLGFIGAGDPVSGDVLGQRVEDLGGTHFGALTAHSRVQLVAGSSRDEGRRRRFAERSGLRTYADWREMLDTEALDIGSVARRDRDRVCRERHPRDLLRKTDRQHRRGRRKDGGRLPDIGIVARGEPQPTFRV